MVACLENKLSIQVTQLALNQRLVRSHRQCKGIIQFMQSSNDEIQILEHEIQRVRSRSAIEDFDVKELQVKAVLARDNA